MIQPWQDLRRLLGALAGERQGRPHVAVPEESRNARSMASPMARRSRKIISSTWWIGCSGSAASWSRWTRVQKRERAWSMAREQPCCSGVVPGASLTAGGDRRRPLAGARRAGSKREARARPGRPRVPRESRGASIAPPVAPAPWSGSSLGCSLSASISRSRAARAAPAALESGRSAADNDSMRRVTASAAPFSPVSRAPPPHGPRSRLSPLPRHWFRSSRARGPMCRSESSPPRACSTPPPQAFDPLIRLHAESWPTPSLRGASRPRYPPSRPGPSR